jgi:uncharacterized damage-inducible protein DinB
MVKQSEVIDEFKGQARLRMEECLEKIRGCLKLLDEPAFWQRPNASSNSAGNLLMHLSGNIRQYMLSGLGGVADIRQRDLEFQTPSALSRTTVESDFFQVAEKALDLLEHLPEEAFLKRKNIQGFDLTGLGIVLHVVEHLSYHTGQIAYLTKMTTDEDLGFYSGIDLNAKNE